MTPVISYLDQVKQIIQRIRATQLEAIDQAAEICATSIAGDGLVHLFGTGHSRMMVEEVFPRHGSFPGFHTIVELSLTFHNQVVGANGQRQARRADGFRRRRRQSRRRRRRRRRRRKRRRGHRRPSPRGRRRGSIAAAAQG